MGIFGKNFEKEEEKLRQADFSSEKKFRKEKEQDKEHRLWDIEQSFKSLDFGADAVNEEHVILRNKVLEAVDALRKFEDENIPRK